MEEEERASGVETKIKTTQKASRRARLSSADNKLNSRSFWFSKTLEDKRIIVVA